MKTLERIHHNNIESINLSSELCIDSLQIPKMSIINAHGVGDPECISDKMVDIATFPKNNLFACCGDGKIYLWDLDQKKCMQIINCDKKITTIIGLPNGCLLSAHEDNTIRIWQPETGEYLGIFLELSSLVWSMKLMQDKLITLTDDGIIRFWTIASKKLVHPILNTYLKSPKLFDLHDFRHVIVADNNNIVGQRWLNYLTEHKLLEDGEKITTVVFNPYNRFICGDCSGFLSVFDLGYFVRMHSLKVAQGAVNSCVVLPDGNIAACFEDCLICLFNPELGRILQIVHTKEDVFKIAVLADSRLAGVSNQGEIYIWEFPTRVLKGDDIFLLFDNILSNESVKMLDISNVILDDYDISVFNELKNKRPELIIRGIPQIGTDYEHM